MSKKLWGGRFKKAIDKSFEDFSMSIGQDYKLASYDLFHSMLHCIALGSACILSEEECRGILEALGKIMEDVRAGRFRPSNKAEDIHTEIHNRARKILGNLAMKLHTLRSRNDQIAFDERMYCRERAGHIKVQLEKMDKSFRELAGKYPEQAFVGYTHTQKAQVVSFSDYTGAYRNMFKRDQERLAGFLGNLKVYIGAGALAGSAIRRHYKISGKHKAILEKYVPETFLSRNAFQVAGNAMDSVSDRDFILEFLSIIAIIQTHLSRLSEDFILYSSQEFDFMDLPEEFCTGSSLMPHKKNPDFPELVRGYAGRAYGNLMSMFTTMKGLPLTYNRDMQLDKEPLFSSVETVSSEIEIMSKFIPGVRLKPESVARALDDERLYATELAEYLVFKKVPFKRAHDVVGKLIRYSLDKGIRIRDMDDGLLAGFSGELSGKTVRKVMAPSYVMSSRKRAGR